MLVFVCLIKLKLSNFVSECMNATLHASAVRSATTGLCKMASRLDFKSSKLTESKDATFS